MRASCLRATKRPTTGRLPLLLGQLGLGAIEHFEKLGDAMTHPAVHVGLGTFDVVV